jgi:LmbE family N-acetylglucosaminyl deacetylase
MKYLVIAAHPDDEILGCGATVAKLAKQGHQVCIAILAEGITSRYSERHSDLQPMVRELRQTTLKVAESIGAVSFPLEGYPDNRMDTIPLLEVAHLAERIIKQVEPQAIYTHHFGDLNIDHQIINRAVLTATRPGAGSISVPDVYTFETPSSTEWAFNAGLGRPFQPNVFVEVTDTLELKLAAMAMYESESRAFPHPRSPEALRAIAMRWGSVAGVEAAEAFELIRSIRL